jgi:hypothetical protein
LVEAVSPPQLAVVAVAVAVAVVVLVVAVLAVAQEVLEALVASPP